MREELRKQNVTCYYEGTKKVGGVDTGEPCIVVGVAMKLPPAQLSPENMIPATCDGMVTDVIQMGQFKALLENTDEHRPMVGGVSLGIKDSEEYGTLGAIVRDATDGALVGLTNNHVLGFFYDPTYGTLVGGKEYPTDLAGVDVVQPSEGDGGEGAAYAHIKRIIPLEVSGGENIVDATIFEMAIDDSSSAIFDLHAGPFPFADRSDIGIGTHVIKSGRTTGVTPLVEGDAEITTVSATVGVSYLGVTLWLDDQMIITGTGFAAAGDSGSVVLSIIDGQYQIVGLLFAASGDSVLANHIDNVASMLNVEAWDGSLVLAHNHTASFQTIAGVVYSRVEQDVDYPITHTILFGTPYLFETIDDGLYLQTDLGMGWIKSISDTLSATDISSRILAVLADEWLNITDTQLNRWRGHEPLSDQVLIYDNAIKQFLYGVADELVIGQASDIAQWQLGLRIFDWLMWDATLTANWRGVAGVETSLYVYDDVVGTKWIVRTVDDELVIGQASDVLKLDLAIALLEHIGFHAAVYVMTTVNLEEILNSQDETRGAYHFTPEDSMAVIDSEPVNTMTCNVTLNDVIDVLGEVIGKSTLNRVIVETITIRDL